MAKAAKKTTGYPKTVYVGKGAPGTESEYLTVDASAESLLDDEDVVELAEYQFVRMVKVEKKIIVT